VKRALVLGAGGAVGLAWECGVIGGLYDGGVDVRDADLIIGTSAGAVAGAHLASGVDPGDVEARHRDAVARTRSGHPARRDVKAMQAVFGLWATFDEMTLDRQRQIAALALTADTGPEDAWVRGFEFGEGWPARPLLVTAVSCETGALRVFDRDAGVPLRRAVAASCAVPGIFPPVMIGGERYTDGVVRSGTSADLAQMIDPDMALIVSVFGTSRPGINRTSAHALAREMAALEAAGTSVRLVRFDEAAQAAIGENMMDVAARLPALEAGHAHGAAVAATIGAWWRGH